MKNLIVALVIAGALVSCGPSTSIVKSWREPNATVTKDPSNKVLLMALVKDETSRRVVEDQLVKRMGNGATASYTMMSAEDLKDTTGAKLNKTINEGKFTHMIILRLADIEKETNYVQGTTTGYYGGYGRYYGYGAGMYSSPGYYVEDKNYFIETAVYSFSPDKLLWTGTTKTVNPSKMEKTITEIADVVTDKMKREGFLK